MIRAVLQLAGRVAKLERAFRSLPQVPAERKKYPVGGMGGESRIWCAPVERSTLLDSGGVAYRWKYKLQRIALTDTNTIEVVAGDTTFGEFPEVYALNELEFENQPQHLGYQGTGVNQADPYPDGFFIEPIGGGSGSTATVLVPVYARLALRPDGSSVWLFTAYNADNGVCE